MPVNFTNLTANALNDQDPYRTNNGSIWFAGLPSPGNSGTLAGNDNVITFAADSFPLPKDSTGMIEVATGNEKRKYAGNTTYEDMSGVFKAMASSSTRTYEALYAWRQQVHNRTNGRTGLASVYKKNGVCVIYPPDGSSVQQQWNLYGVWPSALDAGEVDKSGEDMIRYNVTFVIDKWLYEPNATGTIAAWSANGYPNAT